MSGNKNRKNNGKVSPHEQALAVVPEPPITHVNTQVLHDKNASVVNVQLAKRTHNHFDPPEYEYKASGSAKRERGDVHDETTGELLALSRAFLDLSRQLEGEARKRVRTAAEAEDARKRRTLKKVLRAAEPQRHRTLEEWQEIQRDRQQAAHALLAQSLGLGPVAMEFFGRLSSVSSALPGLPPLPALPADGAVAYTPRHADGRRPDGMPQ
jgi:hypothetical protein